jgi:hypothetical protein
MLGALPISREHQELGEQERTLRFMDATDVPHSGRREIEKNLEEARRVPAA